MSNYVLQPAERAAYEYLKANLPDWLPWQNVYKGIDNPEEEGWFNKPRNVRRYPGVILRCLTPSEPVLPNYHGMWKVNLDVEIWSSRYDVTDEEHEQHCRDVIDRFLTTTIQTDLAAAYVKATGEQVFVKKVIPGLQSNREEGKGWCTTQALVFEEFGHLSSDQIQT